jgi:hypothetical protein
MRLIGAGLGGTGTLQARAALEMLGFGPCYHIAEVQKHPEQIAFWKAAADGNPRDWNAIFDGYESCVDFPACVFYGELLDAYPEAKALLTVRDPERAYERLRETSYKLMTDVDSPVPEQLRRVFEIFVWDRVFGGVFEERAAALEVYRRWADDVRACVPDDRLLVYDVDEGWEPLVRFLGVDAPDEPFPS